MSFAKVCFGETVEIRKHDHYNSLYLLPTGGLVEIKKGATFRDSYKKHLKLFIFFYISTLSLFLFS